MFWLDAQQLPILEWLVENASGGGFLTVPDEWLVENVGGGSLTVPDGIWNGTCPSSVRIVDPDVLGGAIIRAGDTVIDGSVRGLLDKLAETLQRK